MAEPVLDLEALLAPLAEGEGGGGNVREDYSPSSAYQRLRGMRADARAGERAVDSGDPAADPAAVTTAWRDVKKTSISVIAEKAKDFEVAAWLTEALVRLDGLDGLRDGARLITGLCRQYWDQGFPRLDDPDGREDRAAPIGGLAGEGADGTIMQPLRRLTLFHRADGSPADLFLWQRAEETAAIADEERKEQRYKSGVPEMDAFRNEARADGAFLRSVGVAAREAAAAWSEMDAALTERFGGDAPSTRRVSEALTAIQEIAAGIVGALPEEGAASGETNEEEAAAEPIQVAGAPGMAAPATAAGPRPLRTREDAIRQLEELAAFFRKTEPHSPLAFTLEDAVRRARMPLPDLLAEVLPDADVRRAMLSMLGIRVADE